MFLGLLFFLQVLTTPVTNVAAAPTTYIAKSAEQCRVGGGFFGFPTWYKYIKKFDDNCVPEVSFLTGSGEIRGTVVIQVALAIVDILLRLGALLAVGFVMYGGFVYLTSQGEPDGIKRGRQAIMNALVGLVIAISASAIVAFIGNRLG